MENEELALKWKELWGKSERSVYQSLEWANLKDKCGKKPIFITCFKDDALKSGIIAFEQTLSTPLGVKKILVSEGTPLYTDEDSLHEIINKFKQESKKYFYGTIVPTIINQKNEVLSKYMKKASNFTILVDLSRTEEELWKSLEKKSARWGVKTAEKNSLWFLEPQSLDDISEFYSIYKKTASEGGFNPEPIEFLRCLLNSQSGKIFLVKKGNKIIAGCAILLSYDYNVLNLTASTEEAQRLQAMPFVYWNIVLYSKRTGVRYLDLGGYDKEAKEGGKTYNINKFKERFGGQITEQSIYSSNQKYPLVRKMMKRFKIIKKLYKKS
jgi:lipid II:glycine glycyltransferase (peptidoglycan interpeptide bridge formation enzyme)